MLIRELTASSGCIDELNALLTCTVASGQCDVAAECQAPDMTFSTCIEG